MLAGQEKQNNNQGGQNNACKQASFCLPASRHAKNRQAKEQTNKQRTKRSSK